VGVDDFKGKTAVITGGASGIGLAIARALGTEGARIVLADIEQGALDVALAELRSRGFEAAGLVCDVSSLSSVQALADFAWERFGAVHLMFNNAGVAVFGPTQEMSHADWRWVMDVNLWGPIHGTEAFVPRMLAQGEPGHLVYTASFAGIAPNFHLGPYNVTKAAVVALAESLWRDLKGTSLGISVLCPQRVFSNIDKSYRNRPQELAAEAPPEDAPDKMVDARTLSADDVAQMVLAAILRRDLFIVTHTESQASVRRRFERLDAAFAFAI
jgi:NAD(P)-dependent dehydrogenase (short-subunit alcohol dehydrogenase family)